MNILRSNERSGQSELLFQVAIAAWLARLAQRFAIARLRGTADAAVYNFGTPLKQKGPALGMATLSEPSPIGAKDCLFSFGMWELRRRLRCR